MSDWTIVRDPLSDLGKWTVVYDGRTYAVQNFGHGYGVSAKYTNVARNGRISTRWRDLDPEGTTGSLIISLVLAHEAI